MTVTDQHIVKINMQIYEDYSVNHVPVDTASGHNEQLSRPFTAALHQCLLFCS